MRWLGSCGSPNASVHLAAPTPSANDVLKTMERARCHLNVLLLDACRDQPSRMERSTRNALRGLAEMGAPAGSVIAFACAPGKTAQDGSSRNGVFTSHLLNSSSGS